MALFNRNFVLLWQGQLVSQFGNQAFLIATTFYLLEATGSSTVVAGAMMAGTIPLAILGPIGGSVADRHSRRAIVVVTDWLRALAIGALGLVIFWRPDVTPHHIGLIVAVAAFNGVMSALFAPALQAMLPDLVPNGRLAAANSVIQMSRQTSTLVGQALGGLLYVAWGPAGLLLFDASTFIYAGMATWFLPRDQRPPLPKASVQVTLQRYIADTRGGVEYVWRRSGMPAVLGVFAGVNCFFMPVFVLLPFYTRDVLRAGPEWYGFLLGASGAGALAGSIAAGVVLSRVYATASLVRGSVGGIACCVLVVALSTSTWVAMVAFAAIGALSSLINVAVITAFQATVPAEVRGRVMAVVIAVSTAAVPIGMAAGGVLGDVGRGSLPLVFAGSGLAIALLGGISLATRGFSDVLDRNRHETT
ncbi:MAG TPA: MFS transporter [Vicinamibacterales bacterium]|nr:MFS transporter [Vicinamibacterales bacterium]